jgi:hypothetical protein
VLKGQLTKLGLHSMAATFEAEADRAAKSETSFTAYLGRLVELELADKADRSINARIARARFPVLRTLEQFDFSFQPSLSAARVRELASLTFLDHAATILSKARRLPGVKATASSGFVWPERAAVHRLGTSWDAPLGRLMTRCGSPCFVRRAMTGNDCPTSG